MNREELDAFFAKADDVLTDWHGDTDAMHARVPTSDDVEALPGESYYEQALSGESYCEQALLCETYYAQSTGSRAAGQEMGRSMARLSESMAQVGTSLAALRQGHVRGRRARRSGVGAAPRPAGGVVETVPLEELLFRPDCYAFVVNYPGLAQPWAGVDV